MRRIIRALCAAVLALLMLPSVAAAHDILYFDDPYYVVDEGNDASVLAERCCHGTGIARASWATVTKNLDGWAAAGSDFTAVSGSVTFGDPISFVPLNVQTHRGSATVEPVERFRVELKDPTGSPPPVITGGGGTDVFVRDLDGVSRVAFLYPDYSVYANRESVRIQVLRLGPTTGAHSFTYETVDDSAKAGTHYAAKSDSVTIPADKSLATFTIDILKGGADALRFFIELTPADPSAGPTRVPIEILNVSTGDYQPPFTEFHIPRQGKTYKFLPEAHVFADDLDGAGVKRVDLALRKKMASGRCSWWTGSRWRGGKCKTGRAHWYKNKQVTKQNPAEFLVFRLPHLKRTRGTKIASYRVISRGIDLAGNDEHIFRKGHNVRDFKISR
ncbi:hypothetical protein BH20ACT23_BH20ACT23_20530 [soil metagenome]